jgi:hypothetical protein
VIDLGVRRSLGAQARLSRFAALALVVLLVLMGTAAAHAAEPGQKEQARAGFASKGSSPANGRGRSGARRARETAATTVPLAGVQTVLVGREASAGTSATGQLRPELRLALQAGLGLILAALIFLLVVRGMAVAPRRVFAGASAILARARESRLGTAELPRSAQPERRPVAEPHRGATPVAASSAREEVDEPAPEKDVEGLTFETDEALAAIKAEGDQLLASVRASADQASRASQAQLAQAERLEAEAGQTLPAVRAEAEQTLAALRADAEQTIARLRASAEQAALASQEQLAQAERMAAFEAEAAAMLDSLQARAEQTLATIQAGAEQTLASLRAAAAQARPAAAEPLPPAPQAPAAVEPLPPAEQSVWEICEIDCWRGYLKSEFYATATTPEGEEYAAGRSPAFRWRGSGPPEPSIEAVAAAHEALVARLERDGWERYERGSIWYRERLRRSSRRRPS